MKVVLVEPGKASVITEIEHSLEAMQKAVGGLIEPFYAYEDKGVVIICNEEGKLKNPVVFNRTMFSNPGDTESDIVDIIAGTFFVCKIGEENFEGFVDEKEAEYWQKIFEPVHEFSFNEDDAIVIAVK